MLIHQGFAGRQEVSTILRCILSVSDETKISGPPPIEGIDGGPLPAYLFHECMIVMLGVALMATAAVAGAAAGVSARTGPATSEPMVPTVRMAGARMFRRMRMSASMR